MDLYNNTFRCVADIFCFQYLRDQVLVLGSCCKGTNAHCLSGPVVYEMSVILLLGFSAFEFLLSVLRLWLSFADTKGIQPVRNDPQRLSATCFEELYRWLLPVPVAYHTLDWFNLNTKKYEGEPAGLTSLGERPLKQRQWWWCNRSNGVWTMLVIFVGNSCL